MTALLLALAVLLDRLLGEPRRWRPLVGFMHLAGWLERRHYRPERLRGALLTAAVLLPPLLLVDTLAALPGWWGAGASLWILVFVLGHQRLHLRCREAGDAAAICTRILGNDGVFGVLFWFLVAGAPGALLYRLSTTLKALWDARGPRYQEFAWAVTQLDDMLDILPARLAALTYALLGHTRQALDCWREQGASVTEPNATPLLAAGAGALGICLEGGAAPLGTGSPPAEADIGRAQALVRRGVLLWLAVIGLGTLAVEWLAQTAPDWQAIVNFLLESLLA